MKDPNVITYEEMIDQPIQPIESYEEAGSCAGGAVVGLIFILVCIVVIITTVVKGN